MINPLRSIFPLLVLAAALSFGGQANAQNTQLVFTSGTDLTNSANWNSGAGPVPTVANDAVFNSASSGTVGTLISGATATYGSLDDIHNAATTLITNPSASGSSVITLGGSGDLGDSVTGAAAGDLIYTGTGAAILTLTGSTTSALDLVLGQSGNFDVAGGSTLNIGTTGANTLNLGGSTLTMTGAGATNIGSVISNGSITINSGTTALSGANTFGGGVNLNGGLLQLTNAAGAGTGTIAIGNGGTLENQSAGGYIGNFANALTFSGNSNINFIVGSKASGFAGNILLGGTGVALNVGGNSVTTHAVVFMGVISDGGHAYGLTQLGVGTLYLGGANTYTGLTTINSGGTLILGGTDNGGTSGAGATGSLAPAGTILDNGNLTFERTNTATQGTDFTSSPITGTGSLNQAGAGGNLVLNQSNTFTGASSVTSGTITLGNTLAIQNSIVTISAGVGASGTNNGVQFSPSVGGSFTIGGLSGASPEALLDTGANPVALTVGNNGSTGMTYSGILSGAGSLTKIGTGTQTLSGANTFTGGLTIQAGTVTAATSASALGAGGVTLGNTTGSSPATLLVSTSALNFANPITLATNANAPLLTIGNTGSAISTTFSGGVTGANNLTINENATTGTITFSTNPLNNTGTVTNTGFGTGSTTINSGIGSNVTGLKENSTTSGLILTGAASSYTAATTVATGTLTLDFSQANSPAINLISSSSPLVMGGGVGASTFNVIGASGSTNSQTFNGTTINQGASSFTINNNATSNTVLVALGALTRNEGGTVNFAQPVNGSVGATNGYTTSTGNTSGIIGGWATVGGNDWATNNGTNIVAYSGYTSSNGATNPPSGWASGQNISVDGALSSNLPAGTVAAPTVTTINSLRLNNPATTTLSGTTATLAIVGFNSGASTFAPTSGHTTGLFLGESMSLGGTLPIGDYITALTGTTFTVALQATANQAAGATFAAIPSELAITSGGILETSSVGAFVSTIAAGELIGPSNGDIVINQNNGTASTSGLVISSAINNNGTSPVGVTKTGAGYVTLTNGALSFTGPVSVNAGTLEIDPTTTLGATYIGAGATLTQLPSAGGSIANLTVGTLTGGGTLKYGLNTVSIGAFTINETTSSTFSGVITGALTGASVGNSMVVNKNGTGTLNLTGAGGLTDYRGFAVNAGTLDFSGNGTLADLGTFGTTNSRLAAAINQGGVLTLDDTITNVASRLSRIDEALTFNGGTLNLLGSSSAATVEIIQTKGTVSQASHGLIMNSGADVVNATAGTGQSTTLTFNDVYSRNAGASVLFEGTNLGSAPGANVATVLFGTPPTLTGSTGVAGTPTYGVIAGTYVDSVSTGGANSYSIATYDTTNGVRPLASSETIGTLTAGDNVLATSALTNSAVTINSLTLGTGGSIDNTAGILVDASGAILTTGASTSIGSAGGSTLQSGTTGTGTAELSIYNAPSSNLTIGASITTSGGLTKGGAGTTTLTGINSGLSGATTINGGILSISAANNLGSGSIAINNGAELQSTGATVSLSSPITVGGSTAGTLTSGDIDVSGASTNTLTASGVISGAGSLIKSGVGILALSNSNTYVGATIVKAGTLLVSGSLSGSSAVTVGDSANLSTSATLSGGGLVGNITVGAASGNTGATLAPSAGSSSTSAGTKLSTGSLTFFDGSANLSMEIGRTSAFSSGGGNGTAGGDVSDHVLTTGAITLNNANLNLSLLSTSYTLAAGDVLFLIINGSGSAVNGTFASLNGAATNLAQNAIFSFNSQNYEITYNANFTTNSFTGGNDIALEAVAVPEPGTWATVLGGLGVLVAFQRSRRRMVR